MITVKCIYENGNSTITSISLNIEDATKYFLNNYFNLGCVDDNIQKCIEVIEI